MHTHTRTRTHTHTHTHTHRYPSPESTVAKLRSNELVGLILGTDSNPEWYLEQDVAFMVQWVVGSIHHGGPTELFLIPAITPQLV